MLFLFILAATGLQALDFWQHPEIAERNSVFLGAASPSVSFTKNFSFTLSAPVYQLDYLPPTRYPFSLGIFAKTPDPNLTSFGIRLGYNINLNLPKTNLYVLYKFDFGFTRNELLIAHNDEPQPVNFFDFRIGIRHFFFSNLGIFLETDFKFQGINMGVSIKLF